MSSDLDQTLNIIFDREVDFFSSFFYYRYSLSFCSLISEDILPTCLSTILLDKRGFKTSPCMTLFLMVVFSVSPLGVLIENVAVLLASQISAKYHFGHLQCTVY